MVTFKTNGRWELLHFLHFQLLNYSGIKLIVNENKYYNENREVQ